jgi:hypothetical protein
MKNERKILLECDCTSMEHIIQFAYFDVENHPDEFMYICHTLNADRPFFNRLKMALKYLFRKGDYQSMFSDTVLVPSAVRDLESFLQEYAEYVRKHNIFR